MTKRPKAYCDHGHEMTEGNTIFRLNGTGHRTRKCRECDLRRRRKQHELVGFLAIFADQYQRDYGLNGLHPTHYSLMEKYGARMDDFKRATNVPEPNPFVGLPERLHPTGKTPDRGDGEKQIMPRPDSGEPKTG